MLFHRVTKHSPMCSLSTEQQVMHDNFNLHSPVLTLFFNRNATLAACISQNQHVIKEEHYQYLHSALPLEAILDNIYSMLLPYLIISWALILKKLILGLGKPIFIFNYKQPLYHCTEKVELDKLGFSLVHEVEGLFTPEASRKTRNKIPSNNTGHQHENCL